MKKPVSARRAAFLFVLGLAVLHCGGDDSSTSSGGTTSGGSGGATGATTVATTGTQATTTVAGTTSSTSAGAGGSAGATGTGGAGGGFGNCPATQPAAGTSCTALAACPYGSVFCFCAGARSGAGTWTCPDLDGFTFDANFGRPDAGG